MANHLGCHLQVGGTCSIEPWRATRHSTCEACGEEIEIGDEIAWFRRTDPRSGRKIVSLDAAREACGLNTDRDAFLSWANGMLQS